MLLISVRSVGTKIVLKVYDLDPKVVRKKLPPDTPSMRNSSIGFKTLYDEIYKREEKKTRS